MACNVGTGHGTSVLRLIEMTESITGRSVPHEIVARRPGDPSTIYADPTRARTVLDWRATRDLREIISSAYEWHRGHPRGYNR